MRVFIVLAALVLCSCSNLRMARDLRENCIGAYGTCPVDLAQHASLDTLKANGDAFIVECETSFEPIDEGYRTTCRGSLEKLAASLSATGDGVLAPIAVSEIALRETEGCMDTTNGAFDIYGITATIPLRWLDR